LGVISKKPCRHVLYIGWQINPAPHITEALLWVAERLHKPRRIAGFYWGIGKNLHDGGASLSLEYRFVSVFVLKNSIIK